MRASCFGRQLDLSSLRHLVAKLGEIQRSLGVFAEGPLLRSRFEAKRAVEKSAEESSFGGRVRARGCCASPARSGVLFGAHICAERRAIALRSEARSILLEKHSTCLLEKQHPARGTLA